MERELPYLTGADGSIAGVFKARWEDFVVAEIPAVEPSGHGDHTWLEIEKEGLTTAVAASDLARALGVRPSSVGYAGLKDTRAVARQWLSMEHVAPDRALAVSLPRLRVLRAARHPRKLRRGWHAGNRFVIRLRDVAVVDDAGAAPRAPAADLATPASTALPVDVARAVLAVLERRGVPNYYGPQRFGYRGDTWRVGRALARGAWGEAASWIAGRPILPGDDAVDPAAGVHPDGADVARARALFDEGRYGESASAWPRGFGHCVRLAAAMDRTGGDAARSLEAVGKGMLRLYASSYQSWLFNRVLARRVDHLDQVVAGDLAWKHDTEALFLVEDPAAEAARAASFEISATGPLVGRRMREPGGAVGALEAEVLAAAGFRAAELESRALRPLTGRRRPLRFRLTDVAVADGADDDGPYLELRFALPPGCYATAVLRELGKGRIVERSRA
jgi:tRNA pseudouridine13 synthase